MGIPGPVNHPPSEVSPGEMAELVPEHPTVQPPAQFLDSASDIGMPLRVRLLRVANRLNDLTRGLALPARVHSVEGVDHRCHR
jgi:hypothetical protein